MSLTTDVVTTVDRLPESAPVLVGNSSNAPNCSSSTVLTHPVHVVARKNVVHRVVVEEALA